MTERRGSLTWLALAAVVLAAAFFRLYDLGLSALRGDTILLWSMAQRHVPPSLLITKWFEVSGAAGQMPMPAFLMQAFLSFVNWNVSLFTLRLAFAVFGILTVPVAFFAGRRFQGDAFGLVLAALLAVNSFHVATSREAYFYATMVFGNFLFFWATAALVERLWKGELLGAKDLALLAVALFFCGYSQITGLIICATGAVLFFGLLIYRQKRSPVFNRNLLSLIVVYTTVLLPILFVPWGLKPLLAQIGAAKAVATQVSAMSGQNLWTGLIQVVEQFLWGWTVPGLILLGGVVVAAAFAFWRRRDRRIAWLAYFVVMQVIMFAMSRSASGANYESRYLSGTLPFLLAFITYGLLYFPSSLLGSRARSGVARGMTIAFCAIALIPSLYPAYLQTQLTGKPAPYFELVRWTDSNLPQGTPVLVDRWFEPWNELKAHPTTNVFFTFTVPNEPVETYIRSRWRETAQAFFAKYPEAAYLEIAKSYWEVPGVGPWNWPREHFARHVAITNEAGLKLRRMGLANRGDFYAATTNRTIVEIFYNTREDLVMQARAQGRKTMVLFGPGWGYTKTQDFKDWRALEKEAAIEVYNLTDTPADVMLRIRAVAPNGSKRVESATMDAHDFSVGRMEEWDIGPVSLAPGLTKLALRDPFWTDGGVPLLVDTIALAPAPRPTLEPGPVATP